MPLAPPPAPSVARAHATRALVISPHFDDAVFSCGDWLSVHPGTTVATVFAGEPAQLRQQTSWDARCGFADAQEALATRRLEDQRAMGYVSARSIWLDFLDAQYREHLELPAVVLAIAHLLRSEAPSRLIAPLGLFHEDHRIAHDACIAAWRGTAGIELVLYEEAPYRRMDEVLAQRIEEVQRHGAVLSRLPLCSHNATLRKRLAVRAYASQLRGLGTESVDEFCEPEQFWAWRATVARDDGLHAAPGMP